jgi:hypothetical protein
MIEAYPLQWPVGYPRTQWKKSARFDTNFANARDAIVNEIKRFRGKDIVISTDIPVKNDGFPYASFKTPKDCGVAVYFTYENNQVVFACDKWDRVEDNMQAIRKTIEAMRGLDRWGVSDMLNRAFTGFTAIPEKVNSNWWDVLECSKNSTVEEITKAYYAKAKKVHPDKGGSNEEFSKVNAAYEQATS